MQAKEKTMHNNFLSVQGQNKSNKQRVPYFLEIKQRSNVIFEFMQCLAEQKNSEKATEFKGIRL